MSHTKSPSSLDLWIDIATSGLPTSVRIRLSSEIEDHYDNLTRRQLAEGLSQPQAEAIALQQLGEAAKVGNDYRDAHFSRERYSRAKWAVIGLFAVQCVNTFVEVVTRGIQHQPGYTYYEKYFIPFGQFAQVWTVAASLVSAMLVLIIIRGVLTLWREQYDVHITRRVQRVFTISVCMSAGAFAVYTSMDWFSWFVVMDVPTRSMIESPLWRGISAVAAALTGTTPLIISVLLIVFAATAWPAIYRGRNLLARAFTLMVGGVGAAVVLNAVIVLEFLPINSYYVYSYYYPIGIPVLMALFTLFLVLPLRTFQTMSLVGRTLEANGEKRS